MLIWLLLILEILGMGIILILGIVKKIQANKIISAMAIIFIMALMINVIYIIPENKTLENKTTYDEIDMSELFTTTDPIVKLFNKKEDNSLTKRETHWFKPDLTTYRY